MNKVAVDFVPNARAKSPLAGVIPERCCCWGTSRRACACPLVAGGPLELIGALEYRKDDRCAT